MRGASASRRAACPAVWHDAPDHQAAAMFERKAVRERAPVGRRSDAENESRPQRRHRPRRRSVTRTPGVAIEWSEDAGRHARRSLRRGKQTRVGASGRQRRTGRPGQAAGLSLRRAAQPRPRFWNGRRRHRGRLTGIAATSGGVVPGYARMRDGMSGRGVVVTCAVGSSGGRRFMGTPGAQRVAEEPDRRAAGEHSHDQGADRPHAPVAHDPSIPCPLHPPV